MAGKTEWEDILIKHGIMEAPPVVPTEDELQSEAAERELQRDALADKSLAELDALEDDVDEKTLKAYREKRLEELREAAKRNRFGSFQTISQTEYSSEVTQAGPGVWVVIHLFAPKTECQLLDQCMAKLAPKFKAVKFLRIASNDAIPNYPDKNCPTLLIYKEGDVKMQQIGLEALGGLKMNPDCLEWWLASIGVLQTEMEENPILALSKTNVARVSSKARTGVYVKSGSEGDDGEKRASEAAAAYASRSALSAVSADELAEMERELDMD